MEGLWLDISLRRFESYRRISCNNIVTNESIVRADEPRLRWILRNDLGKFYKCQIHVSSIFPVSRDSTSYCKASTSCSFLRIVTLVFCGSFGRSCRAVPHVEISKFSRHLYCLPRSHTNTYDNTHYCEQLVVACGLEYRTRCFASDPDNTSIILAFFGGRTEGGGREGYERGKCSWEEQSKRESKTSMVPWCTTGTTGPGKTGEHKKERAKRESWKRSVAAREEDKEVVLLYCRCEMLDRGTCGHYTS